MVLDIVPGVEGPGDCEVRACAKRTRNGFLNLI